jgi:hypothetical protein
MKLQLSFALKNARKLDILTETESSQSDFCHPLQQVAYRRTNAGGGIEGGGEGGGAYTDRMPRKLISDLMLL